MGTVRKLPCPDCDEYFFYLHRGRNGKDKARETINRGYRAHAKEVHPDKLNQN